MATVGSIWMGEELGRALPGVPVVVSGVRETHGVIDEVDDAPRFVVATPGAEPVTEDGHRAVLLLDGATLSSRPDLGAAGETLCQRSNAAALVAPSACVVLLGSPEPMVAQALARQDQAGFARRDLLERVDLHPPLAWRVVRLDGPTCAVEFPPAQAEADGFEVFGPVALPPVRGQALPGAARALTRTPLSRGKAFVTILGVRLRDRSAHHEEPARAELDLARLW